MNNDDTLDNLLDAMQIIANSMRTRLKEVRYMRARDGELTDSPAKILRDTFAQTAKALDQLIVDKRSDEHH